MATTAFKAVANNAQTTLAEDLTDVETDITVATGHGARFPAPATDGQFYVTIWDEATYPDPGDDPNMEVMLCTARSSDVLTVTRGQRGTSGVAHYTDDTLALLADSTHISDLNTAVNAIENWAGNSGFRVFEDFMGRILGAGTAGNNASPMGWVAYWIGSAPDIGNTLLTSAHPGVCELLADTGTTNMAALYMGNPNSSPKTLILGGGAWTFEALINLEALSDGTNEYDVRFGCGDSSSGEPTNGVFFEYNRNNSVNWHACTKSGGTPTRTDTTIAVAAATWIKLKIVVNAAASSIGFYIDGTLRATITTNIPSTAQAPFIQIVKSAGSSTRTCYIDYLDVLHTLTTAR